MAGKKIGVKRKLQKTKGKAKRAPKKKKCLPERSSYGPPLSENTLVAELSEDLQDAWWKLRDFSARMGEQRIYTSHKAIMFSRKVCYFFVRPRKSFLEVCVFLPNEIESSAFHSRKRVSKSKVAHLFRLVHADQVEEPLTNWIKCAYSSTAEA